MKILSFQKFELRVAQAVVGTVITVMTGHHRLTSQEGYFFFLFITVFRPVVGPTQSPIHCTSGALCQGVT
jgi:hypothetical protein